MRIEIRELAYACLLLAVTSGADGQIVDIEQTEAVFDYQPPRNANMSEADYPWNILENGLEGWVLINFMVDGNGEPFEPIVTASVGSNWFEREALTALMKSDFEPALLNGEPIEGSRFQKYIFRMATPANGARRPFIRMYDEFSRLMAGEEINEARQQLSEINSRDVENLYEASFTDFANYLMAKFDEDAHSQLNYLQAALSFESQDREMSVSYFPAELIPAVRLELLMLLIENNRFAESFRAFNLIADTGNTELVNALRPTMGQIRAILTDDSSYGVYGQISDSAYWFINVYKPSFYFEDVVGKIDEINLACETKHIILAYEEDAQYTIPESWGRCSMRLLGEPETEFILVQGPREIN